MGNQKQKDDTGNQDDGTAKNQRGREADLFGTPAQQRRQGGEQDADHQASYGQDGGPDIRGGQGIDAFF